MLNPGKVCWIVLAAAVVCGGRGSAEELDIHGDFAGPILGTGLPKGWEFHEWEGYLPKPVVSCIPGKWAGTQAMRLGRAEGKFGSAVKMQERRRGGRGDKVRVTLFAKGKGRAWVTLVRWTGDQAKGWNQTERMQPIDLSETWKLHECPFTLQDGPNGATTAFQVELGLDSGSEGAFADVLANHESASDIERNAVKPDSTRNLGRRLKVLKEIRRENFESAGAPGFAKFAQEESIVAPGLLEKTKLGVYAGSDILEIPFGKMDGPIENGTDFRSASVRLHELETASIQIGLMCGGAGSNLVAVVGRDANEPICRGEIRWGGQVLGQFRLPCARFPADLTVGLSPDGAWLLQMVSLSDSSSWIRHGRITTPVPNGKSPEAFLRIEPNAGSVAHVKVDELAARIQREEIVDRTPPLQLARTATFDPVQSGWPLVFADEFDGSDLDWGKWFVPWYLPTNSVQYVSLDGAGHLRLNVQRNPQTKKLETSGIWTKDSWRWGYFEARLRFTRQPGWWSAFWLYGISNQNPLWDGFEIDIQEDYYTRPEKAGGPERRKLDHNVHVIMSDTLKSWNFNSELPGSLDDFYTLGCKWTPFEISYYLNGRLISSHADHSPYDSVTFDAYHHVFATTPLHAIVSGQIMGEKWNMGGRACDTETEDYLVDYVRVYKYPEAKGEVPEVVFAATQDRSLFAEEGSRLVFRTEVKPGSRSSSPIQAVYLFDNGFLMDFKREPPFEFSIPFTKSYYASSLWTKPGRSGERPDFDARPHVFVVAAQAQDGRVGYSDRVIKILRKQEEGRPFPEKPHVIPGAVPAVEYDRGGLGVAYYDTTKDNRFWGTKVRPEESVDAGPDGIHYVETGEWLNYTVDIAAGGAYTIAVSGECSRIPGTRHLPLYLDGHRLGEFAWNRDQPTSGRTIDATLPKGRHTFTILLERPLEFKGLDFVRRPDTAGM